MAVLIVPGQQQLSAPQLPQSSRYSQFVQAMAQALAARRAQAALASTMKTPTMPQAPVSRRIPVEPGMGGPTDGQMPPARPQLLNEAPGLGAHLNPFMQRF